MIPMKEILTFLTIILSLSISYGQTDSLRYFIGSQNDSTFLIFPNFGRDIQFDPIKINTTIPTEIDSLKKRILPYRFKKEYPKERFEKEAILRKLKQDSMLLAITNTPIPDFDAPDTEGVTHRPKAYEGRVLILHFWNFWDYSFENEIPVLNELVEKYHGEGLEILSFTDLALGDSEKEYLKKHPIKFPLIENSRVFMHQFIKLNYRSILYIIITDKKGNMRYFYIDNEIRAKRKRIEFLPNGDPIQYAEKDKNIIIEFENKILSLLKEI
jgi:AhpC/TSA family